MIASANNAHVFWFDRVRNGTDFILLLEKKHKHKLCFLTFVAVATGRCKGTNDLQVKQQPKFKFYIRKNWI